MSALHHSSPAPTADGRPARVRRRRRMLLATLAAVLAATVALSIGINATASALGAHEHGTLDIRLDGETIDLDQPRFHERHPEFHVHEGHGNLWHHHPEKATGIFGFEPMRLAEALTAIGVELGEDTVAFDGVVYRVDPEAGLTVRVNGADVDPDTHVVTDGDAISVDLVTDG